MNLEEAAEYRPCAVIANDFYEVTYSFLIITINISKYITSILQVKAATSPQSRRGKICFSTMGRVLITFEISRGQYVDLLLILLELFDSRGQYKPVPLP